VRNERRQLSLLARHGVRGRGASRSWAILAASVLLAEGCQRHVQTRPPPLPAAWEYCWWTVIRSTRSLDSVASGFRRAFVTVGLPNIHWTSSADTIWVRGGPAPLPTTELPRDTATYGATYWSRIVAFRDADSTHFRLYIAVVPPARGWADSTVSNHLSAYLFSACEAIARASEVRWIRRAGDPGDEEKLSVWSRVP
jgi:hypothetical protein